MKKSTILFRICIFVSFFLFAFSSFLFSMDKTIRSVFVPTSLRVMIDPGHGGHDEGVVDTLGSKEKEISLEMAYLVQEELERLGKKQDVKILTKLTRTEDDFVSLSERVRLIKSWNADLFLSLHVNSSPLEKTKGFEVYFLSVEASDQEAKRLAELENGALSHSKSKTLGTENPVAEILKDAQGALQVRQSSVLAEILYQNLSLQIHPKETAIRQAPFQVLTGLQVPSVLIELGYLTNPEDRKRLKKRSFLKSMARAISNSVLEFRSKQNKNG